MLQKRYKIQFVFNSKSLMTESKKEGNVLFNDALNTFCLRLYGMVKKGPLR